VRISSRLSISSCNNTESSFYGLFFLALFFSCYFFLVLKKQSIHQSSGRVLPSIKGQAAVIFTVLHFFAWVGMLCWGGGEVGDPLVTVDLDDGSSSSSSSTTSGPESWVGAEPYYYLLNFNSYSESLVTLVSGAHK
jgi:hypothetical protein